MSDLESLPLRPELVGQEPYGAPQLKVEHELNVNENPHPPSAEIRAKMAQAILAATFRVNRYPDREAISLRRELANYLGHGLSAEQIWVANGSNEIMTHILGAFGGPGRTMLTFAPAYSMYPEYARNTHTSYVVAERDENYLVTPQIIASAVERYRPDVVVITTPNNPTGTVTSLSAIETLCSTTDAMVVVDEAYQEFATTPSALTLLSKYPRLVVTRTMSKAFALAGGRVGYLAASSAVVDACRIVRLPYHLSTQSQVLAEVALRHAPQMLAKVAELREECQLLQSWLRQEGYDVIPSEANFCLFGIFEDRHAVWRHLLDRGVLVRETGPDGYLRVSAGTPEQMTAFRAALSEWKGK